MGGKRPVCGVCAFHNRGQAATLAEAATIRSTWDDHNGNTSFLFIVRSAGASVTSASANFTPSGAYSRFVVSHCTRGESCVTLLAPSVAA
jgi:hypothetical protein